MPPRAPDAIYRDLSSVMATAFPDRDPPGDVGPHTRVFADLGMASIDVVVLGEKLEQFYGRKLPFGQFLAGLRNRGADDIELGELVAFLQQLPHLTPAAYSGFADTRGAARGGREPAPAG